MRLSFRARLSFWNMVVLALVLCGFGAAICYRVQASVAAAIDQELAEDAEGAQRFVNSRRFRRRLWRQYRHGPERMPSQSDRDRGGNDDFRGERSERASAGSLSQNDKTDTPVATSTPPVPTSAVSLQSSPQLPEERPSRNTGTGPERTGANASESFDAEAAKIADFRRPRVLDSQGKSMGRGPFNNDRPWDTQTFNHSKKGQKVYSTVTVGQDRLRVISIPLRQTEEGEGRDTKKGRIIGVIQLARELTMYDRLLADQIRILVTLVPIALLVTGVGGLFLTNRALRPVHEVTEAAAEIGAHDLARRLEVNGNDELAEMATTFNAMIARLDSSFNNLESAYSRLEEAYEQQRRFTADASHELRTPLARIKGSTSLALVGEWSPEEYRNALAVADDAADKMNRIIQDLLLLARSDAGQLPQLYPMDLSVVLEHTIEAVPNEKGVPIKLNLPETPLEIMGDADHLSRVFNNLLENAIRYTPADGSITVAAQSNGDNVIVTVADTGEGIPAEHIPHLFERFYRVDPARSRSCGGTGLGLAISQSIVHAHSGMIGVESKQNCGTKVIVTLPGKKN